MKTVVGLSLTHFAWISSIGYRKFGDPRFGELTEYGKDAAPYFGGPERLLEQLAIAEFGIQLPVHQLAEGEFKVRKTPQASGLIVTKPIVRGGSMEFPLDAYQNRGNLEEKDEPQIVSFARYTAGLSLHRLYCSTQGQPIKTTRLDAMPRTAPSANDLELKYERQELYDRALDAAPSHTRDVIKDVCCLARPAGRRGLPKLREGLLAMAPILVPDTWEKAQEAISKYSALAPTKEEQ